MEFSVHPSLIPTSQDVFIQNQNRGVPVGLNAAPILGQARWNVILFNNNNPRNVVTQGSHGFIIRDAILKDSLIIRDAILKDSLRMSSFTLFLLDKSFPIM
jgi:hypothetical protein